ncbi:MAG: DUF2163 domain-containing protein [Xenococcaceae cyanobacterium]
MKTLSSQLKNSLNSESQTICACWLLTLTNGTRLGFTDNSHSFTIDSVTYQADAGLIRSNTDIDASLTTNNLDLNSVLDSDAITDEMISTGQLDAASVRVFLVDYLDLPINFTESKHIDLITGWVGEITTDGRSYKAEARGLSDRLSQSIELVTSGECGNNFCDYPRATIYGRCRLNVANFTYTFAIAQVIDDLTYQVTPFGSGNANTFTNGIFELTTGANNGFASTIVSNDASGIIKVYQKPPYTVSVGDACRLIVGCRKTPDDCSGRFSNIANFSGLSETKGDVYRIEVS